MQTPPYKTQSHFNRPPFLVKKSSQDAGAQTEPNTPLVIILDDQRVGRAVLSEIIRSLDPSIRVEAYSDPQVALTLAAQVPPDLVITDYKMPEMDGLEFTRRLRNLAGCEETPLLMVSIVDDRELLYRALEAGASDFLYRPIDRQECTARARNLLALSRQQRIARQRARWLEERVAEETLALRERECDLIARLARLGEYRSPVSGNHYWRVARYARLIAEALGLAAKDCAQVELATQLHDIGMAGLPDVILRSNAPLSEKETDEMYTHTQIGHNLLQGSPSPLLDLAAQIALYHHEHWDGSGHPHGLAGEDIPLAARIVAVADCYDELTRRSSEYSEEDALRHIIEVSGSILEPTCVQAFVDQFDEILHVQPPPDQSPNRHN